ncbi:dehydrodolichyl diphosphate synthase 2 [Citrus sinensis]|uniref:Dehydrodolichyl diphosphate synthase 2 n=1 Tax=Citrus sinensis TaxID=2711 RepID=A0ACB8IXG1_CITSI|nr:dehydrodolichyl diphosphate synthase 2 [Citrus sinensis]
MPRHVAVIMDGNVRWARQRGLPSSAGHEAGVRSLRELVELCCRWGVKVLTVFAFSYDNWVEVEFLMKLFEKSIKSELEGFISEGIRISMIGDSSRLPKTLQELVSDAEDRTKNNSNFQLIVAVSYSGKYDVVQACKSIAQKVKDDVVRRDDIDKSLIEQELETSCTDYPYPGILIRTSRELRVSNFLLWQLAYTEFFFVQTLWPDFGKAEFVDALTSFQQRKRRYGRRDS